MDKFVQFVSALGSVISGFVAKVQKAAADSLKFIALRLMPLLVMVSLFNGFINGTGIGRAIANFLAPLASSFWGLLLLSFICSIPILSPLLAPASMVAQVAGGIIGAAIGAGQVPPMYALPALWAVDAQSACDSLPMLFGVMECPPEDIEVGVPAFLVARMVTGPLGVVVGYILSIGLF